MDTRPGISPDISPGYTLAEQLAAAQQWWRDAGVDQLFVDAAQSLLPDEAEADAAPPPAMPFVADAQVETPQTPRFTAADLPGDLAAFRQWWLDPQSPLPATSSQRVAPRGEAEAELLMLVPTPEAGDRDALLQGPQGRLLGNIARALGIAEGHTYLASALPTAMELPDWQDLADHGLGSILRHHVALARPRRVLVFGRQMASLLGVEDPARPTSLNLTGGSVNLLVTHAPENLLAHARQRARLWERLLQWTSPA